VPASTQIFPEKRPLHGCLCVCLSVCVVEWKRVRAMQCCGWPVGGSLPCPGCVQAQRFIDVLRRGMHPDCADAYHISCLIPPQHQHPSARPLQVLTRLWASAQHDGRPAECRWRRLFNAAVWVTATTRVPCSNAAKTRNPLKLAGVPQTNEPISAASGPNFIIL